MGAIVSNNATTTLASGITNVATSITVSGGTGSLFPSPSGGTYFYATLVDSSNNIEIVKCTARSSDTLTVVRGAEGTTNRAYSAGDRIEVRPTAALFNEKVSNAGTALTSGRVPYASTNGILVDSANMTFNGTTLTVTGFSNTGNTVIGDASGDTLTIHPSAVTWQNNPTHSGNHTFSGVVKVSVAGGAYLDLFRSNSTTAWGGVRFKGSDDAVDWSVDYNDAVASAFSITEGVTSRLSIAAGGAVTIPGALTTNGGLQTFGANDSGGAGFRLVLVPNV